MKSWNGTVIVTGLAVLGSMFDATPSWAQSEQCEVAQPLSASRLLRRSSLDLRNRVPTVDEMRAAEAAGEIPGAVLDEYLASQGFREVMREHHRELLWPNLDAVELFSQAHLLVPLPYGEGEDQVVYYGPLRAVFMRAVGDGNLYTPCRYEPAEWDEDGHLVLEPVLVGTTTVAWTEGYVEVEPYWAPGTTIKVCALDALDSLVGRACPGPADRYPFAEQFCRSVSNFDRFMGEPFRGRQIDCSSPFAFLSPDCGCGPNLQHCATPQIVQQTRQSFIEQQMRMVDRVVDGGLPYETLLTSTELEWNGHLVHYMRHQASLVLDLYAGDPSAWSLPDLDFTDERWVASEASGRHAGVLTTPGYLLRFAANRMRAHRYYDAFECRSFVPNGPLPSPFEPCSQREDLTERCGCDACHVALEPLAAHWGRFAEYGVAPLPADRFPATIGASCSAPIDTAEQLYRCLRNYELDPQGEEEAYRGFLNAYVFRDPSEFDFIEGGPRRRVDAAVTDGTLQRCAVQRLWTRFMHRPPSPDETAEVLPTLVEEFEASGRRLDELVRAIVTHPAYRRTR
jgi:hypothetical protein